MRKSKGAKLISLFLTGCLLMLGIVIVSDGPGQDASAPERQLEPRLAQRLVVEEARASERQRARPRAPFVTAEEVEGEVKRKTLEP
jgi:hypothetical protein